MMDAFCIKGNVLFTKEFGSYEIFENSVIVVEDNLVVGVYPNRELPERYEQLHCTDYGDCLIIPGFVDLHLHAPQFGNLGLGLDKELMPWLEAYTFPEEAKFRELSYAYRVYSRFVSELWRVGTTRSVLFATIHREATELLMKLVDKAGLCAFVGKVNMDQNAPASILESTGESLRTTEEWLVYTRNRYINVQPIITPRFVPTCSGALMKGLGELAEKYNIGVQSHLSENYGEMNVVKQLHPEHKDYASVYDSFGLLGQKPTIMAHCVHLSRAEMKQMAENQVFVAHSPNSNLNLASGIAPVRMLIDEGIPVGLASDISGGHTLSMMDVIVSSAQSSNMKWLEQNRNFPQLTTPQLFYLATKGGGRFFGKVGSFEAGYEFDALIIDDHSLPRFRELTLPERLQKFLYTGDDRNILKRYVRGKLIQEPVFTSPDIFS